ncbi:cell division protein FtsK, partial [Pyxidicoccus fallax]|uniref:MXAN_5187 family protein n=1 Tax=Pyxidicoccus fallax TaxID=394095 RepID=UPI00149439AC
MVRLKFLVFALLVLGLGVAHLPMLSGPQRDNAVAQATSQAAVGAAEVARRVDARRAEVQALALKLAASQEVASAVAALKPAPARAPAPRNARDRDTDSDEPSGPQPLTADRFAAVRTAAGPLLPKELKGAVVALVTPDAQFHAAVGGEPSSDTAKLDAAAVVKAGATPVADAFGAPHAFASVPLLWNGSQPLVTLVVGAPLVDAATLEAAVQAAGVAGLALVKGDAVVAGAGPEQALAEGSLAQVQANGAGVVLRSGQLQGLGPVMLPAFTNGDFMGGKAPLMVGARRSLEGTALEVLAVADTRAVLAALAAYQQNAFMGLGGLLGLTLLWTLLMGSGRGGDDVKGNSDTLSLSAAMAASPPPAQQHQDAPPAPVAAPMGDPFAAQPPPAADPFAMPAPPVADPFAMPAPPPAADPFSMSPPGQAPMGDPFALPPPTPTPAPAANSFASADPFACLVYT